jgi:nucleoside-diphosphate-sugar epimerase
MHVLLTGASSFVGRHLTEHLLRAGLQVTATYRTSRPVSEPLPSFDDVLLDDALRVLQLDIADQQAFVALPGSIDAVVHVAALSTAAGVSSDEMIRCNVAGTQNVLRYALAAGAAKIIYTSSLSVHGRVAAQVVDENTPVIDADLYGASKYFGERLLAAAADRLPCVAIRLPGVLGRGAHRAWIPSLLERIRAGNGVTLYNPHAPFNNAAHVDDLGRFCVGLLARQWTGFSAFPVAAAGMTTIREVVERLISATGTQVTVSVRAAPQPGFAISSEFAVRRFAYNPMEIGLMLDRYVAEAS